VFGSDIMVLIGRIRLRREEVLNLASGHPDRDMEDTGNTQVNEVAELSRAVTTAVNK
jgi:hypothetical protein